MGIIYFDFECGFIWVEVMFYDVLDEVGLEVKVKENGKLCLEGKDYVM